MKFLTRGAGYTLHLTSTEAVRLLACAGDTNLTAESNKTNNCRASGTAVAVSP